VLLFAFRTPSCRSPRSASTPRTGTFTDEDAGYKVSLDDSKNLRIQKLCGARALTVPVGSVPLSRF